jgi:soluble lytic murein transglycosylase
MVKNIQSALFIVVFIGSLAGLSTSHADIYKYVDANGIIYFTNIPKGKKYKKILTESKTSKYSKNTSNPRRYQSIIDKMSMKYNIKPSLVKAVIKTESNWDVTAISKKGAIGLMQLMPGTAQDMAVNDPYNPEENIEGGIRYLKYLLDKYHGDLKLTLAAYNAGPETVGKYRGIPPIPETRQYVKRVLSLYKDTEGKVSVIYKYDKKDGTVVYTNTPLTYEMFTPQKF